MSDATPIPISPDPGGGAPPPEKPSSSSPSNAASPSPPDDKDQSAKGPGQHIQLGTVTSGSTSFIHEQTVHNHLRVVARYLESDSVSADRPFSVEEDAKPVTENLAAELEQTFVGDDAATKRLLRQLEERRVLLLTGEREIGKCTTALYLAVQTAREKKVHGDPLLVDSLERHIGINLREIAADTGGFGNRTTVFVDAFEQRNTQLRAFFGNADHMRWEQLTELLRRNEAYFIFTSTSASVPFRSPAADRIAHCELQPLREEWIRQVIDKRLEWMVARESTVRGRVELLSEHKARIVAELKTLSQVVSFLHHFMRDEGDVESSLQRFHDTSLWFRTAMERDVDAWTFAFALTLSQPTRDANTAPYADFERVRHAFSKSIHSDPELFPKRRTADGVEESEQFVSVQPFADDRLIERCRAEVTKDSNRLGDIVRFEHAHVTRQLWGTILTHYRRILMIALPTLRSVAEEDRNDWSLRVLAAQIIGRIGEVDPLRISLPIIREWAASGDQALRPLVGRVLQGSLASGSEAYRNAALRTIEWLADTKAMGGADEAKDGVLTAIGAYAQIGLYEPALAMERLGAIVTEYLAPILDDFYKSARDAETVDTQLSHARSNRAAELLRRRLQLSSFATRVFAENAPTMIALGQTVTYLCLAHDVVQILRGMRDWIAKGGPSTGVLVSLLFLRGIAIDLQALPANARTLTTTNTSPLLLSLAMSKDAVHHFCSFLADIHASIHTPFVLPAWLQNDSEAGFAESLMTWAREAVTDSDHRRNVLDVFVGLANARRGSVRRDLLTIIGSTSFTETESMCSFANDVRGRLNDRV